MAPFAVIVIAALTLPSLSRVATHHFGRENAATNRIPFDIRAAERRFTPYDLFLLVILIGFAGFRTINVGTDTSTYARAFEIIDPAYWSRSVDAMPHEIGYTSLALIVKASGGDFTALLLVTSTITVGAAYWAIKRASKDVPLAIGLYVLLAYYLTPMNLTRQGMSVAIVFLAATCIAERLSVRRLLVFTALAVVATSFHTTALIAALVVLAVRAVRLTVRRALWALVLSAAVTASLWASDWLSQIMQRLFPRYETYFEVQRAGGIGTYLLLAVTVALVFYALALKPGRDDLPWATFAVVGCFALLMGTQSIYAVRLADYFTIFLVLLVPNAMRTAGVPTFHRVLLLLLAGAYFVVHLTSFGGLTPYETSISL